MEKRAICYGDVFLGAIKGWKNRRIEFHDDSILIFKNSIQILCVKTDSILEIKLLPSTEDSKSVIILKSSCRNYQFRFYLDKGYSIFLSEVLPKVHKQPDAILPNTLSEEEIKTDHIIVDLFSKIKNTLLERERELIASLNPYSHTQIAFPDISQIIQNQISLRRHSTCESEVKRICGNPYFIADRQREETVSFRVTTDVLLKGISVIRSNFTFVIPEIVLSSMDGRTVIRHSKVEVVETSEEFTKRIDLHRPVILNKNSWYDLTVLFPQNSQFLGARVEKGYCVDGVIWEFKEPCLYQLYPQERSFSKEGRVAIFHFTKFNY